MADGNDQQNKIVMPSIEPTDWTISELYSRSFELVKRYKVLWVFGMAVAGLASGTGFNNFSNFSSSDTKSIQKYLNPSPDATPDKISQVLGDATSQSAIADLVGNLASSIPVGIYVLLGIEILILVIAGIVVSLISSSWANAGLIQSIQTALKGTAPTIQESSEKAFPSIKPLIWLSLIPTLVLWIVTLLVAGVVAAGIVWGGSIKFVFIILAVVAFFAWAYAIIKLVLAQIWAQRIVIIENEKWLASLKRGLKIAKKKGWAMVLLGLVNTIFSGIITGVPIMVIGGLLVGGFLSLKTNMSLGIPLLTVGGILLAIFIFGFLLFAGILTAFKASVWTIAYIKIRGKYDKE